MLNKELNTLPRCGGSGGGGRDVPGRDEWRTLKVFAKNIYIPSRITQEKQADNDKGRYWRQINIFGTMPKASIHIVWEKEMVNHSCIFYQENHMDVIYGHYLFTYSSYMLPIWPGGEARHLTIIKTNKKQWNFKE